MLENSDLPTQRQVFRSESKSWGKFWFQGNKRHSGMLQKTVETRLVPKWF